MDIMLLFGFGLAAAAVYFGVPEFKETYRVYFHYHSFVLVIGGTLAATVISTSTRAFRSIVNVFIYLIIKPKKRISPEGAVALLVALAEKAHAQGKPAILDSGKNIGDGFLEQALSLVGTGLDTAFIQKTLEVEIIESKRRHTLLINMVRTMGSYAPLFGMIGTILGIMEVLRNVSDIENVVGGMALALITTLYGLVLSSVVFIPLANKLQWMSEQELLSKEIMLEGILSILKEDIPLKIEKYLTSYLESKYRKPL